MKIEILNPKNKESLEDLVNGECFILEKLKEKILWKGYEILTGEDK